MTDFEKETGCKVNVKVGGTSDEMVTLMRTGEYDGVSASGDASARLVEGGDVTRSTPTWSRTTPTCSRRSRTSRTTRFDGVNYGIPHGRGANLLLWNTDDGQARPDVLGRRRSSTRPEAAEQGAR